MVNLYPVFCNLAGLQVTVVGGGQVALRRVKALLTAVALVRVIAPECEQPIRELAEARQIDWEQRRYRHGDLQGSRLVLAATNDPEVNRQVVAEAQELGIWSNSVTEPEQADFFVPAVVRRGPLQIGISTSGLSPAVARQIRADIEEKYTDEYIAYLEIMNDIRKRIQAAVADPAARADRIRRFAESDLLLLMRTSSESVVRDWIDEQLAQLEADFTDLKKGEASP